MNRYHFIGAVLFVCFGVTGTMDLQDAEIAEAQRQDDVATIAGEAVAAAISDQRLSHPIGYDATVTQSGYGIKVPRTRYYFARHREGLE